MNELEDVNLNAQGEKVIVYELTKPIKAHGESLTKLELREPTGKEVREIGLLMEVGKGGKTTVNTEAVAEYIVNLAGIPKSSVDQLSAKDFQNIGLRLTIFFA